MQLSFLIEMARFWNSGNKSAPPKRVNSLTAFGLFAVTAGLISYALESHSSWFTLAFAVSCALGSVYGFLQGAWPFGLVEIVWTVVALHRWWRQRKSIA